MKYWQASEKWQTQLSSIGYFDQLPTEVIPVPDSLGRVIAKDAFARISVPHYPAAAMDGIAVSFEQTQGASVVSPRRFAILPCGVSLAQGTCRIVDTGDVIPSGADAVIMREDIARRGDVVEITAPASPGKHVRAIGEDITAGELVLSAGRVIRPVDTAALLATGIDAVEVFCKPIVTVIPTGAELVDRIEDLEPGKIRDVDSYMIEAAVVSWGGRARRHAIVTDDCESLERAVLDSVAHSDIVALSGGTSMGTEDFTARILSAAGEIVCRGIDIRPGKPVILAIVAGKPVVGLPGYPASCMLTAELFVREILCRRQGKAAPPRLRLSAYLTADVHSRRDVDEFIRIELKRLDDGWHAIPLARGAGLITSLTKADGYLVMEAGCEYLSAGTEVTIEKVDWA